MQEKKLIPRHWYNWYGIYDYIPLLKSAFDFGCKNLAQRKQKDRQSMKEGSTLETFTCNMETVIDLQGS